MKKKINLLLSFLLILCLVSCSKTLANIEKTDNVGAAVQDNTEAVNLFNIISEINGNSADSVSRKLALEGYFGNKNIKVAGSVLYIKNADAARLVIYDAVLNSPFLTVISYRDKIKIYNSFENILFIENKNKFSLKSYLNIDLNYKIVHDLAACRIPLIGYIKFKTPDDKDPGTILNNKYLILENNKYFQTISFNGGIPDKILLLEKATGERIEIYLEKPDRKDDMLAYGRIKIISQAKFKIFINFSKTRMNIPLDLNGITSLKLAGNTRVIDRY